jgi:hypothetical protein
MGRLDPVHDQECCIDLFILCERTDGDIDILEGADKDGTHHRPFDPIAVHDLDRDPGISFFDQRLVLRDADGIFPFREHEFVRQ